MLHSALIARRKAPIRAVCNAHGTCFSDLVLTVLIPSTPFRPRSPSASNDSPCRVSTALNGAGRLLGLCVALLGVGALAGCSSSSAASPPASLGAGSGDAGATSDPDGGESDGTEASALTSASLACLGDSAPLTFAFGLPYATVTVEGAGANFLVDYATTNSTIDLNAFSPWPATQNCDTRYLGANCTFDPVEFFDPLGARVLITADHDFRAPGELRQAGILGTDILAEQVYTLDYKAKRIKRAHAAAFCSASKLESAGLHALSTEGFFASDSSKLKKLSEVVRDAASGVAISNVPTVPLRIAGASAPAQLDTGFGDDLYPFSINVNKAFFDAIVAANPNALVRASSKDLSLTTCTGTAESVDAYDIAADIGVDLVDVHGGAAHHFDHGTVFVKSGPAFAKSCGGIGTWSVPAAQIGSSFFSDLGVLVFDPFGSRVWVD